MTDCSDSVLITKPPWGERKEHYIAALASHDPDSVLVSCADKLHNARAILVDYGILGERLWQRFNPDSDTLWYYRALADAFLSLGTPLAVELDRTVSLLETLVRQGHGETAA